MATLGVISQRALPNPLSGDFPLCFNLRDNTFSSYISIHDAFSVTSPHSSSGHPLEDTVTFRRYCVCFFLPITGVDFLLLILASTRPLLLMHFHPLDLYLRLQSGPHVAATIIFILGSRFLFPGYPDLITKPTHEAELAVASSS